MLRNITESIFYFTLVFGILWTIVLLMGCTPQHERKYVDYYYVGETVPFAQCKTLATASGFLCVNLSGCTSGREYYCVTNVYTKPRTEHTKAKPERTNTVFTHWIRK